MGLSALGVANFMMAWLLLQETRPEALFVSASQYARDYVGLLRSRQFLGYAVGGACATTSFYAFIACAPFIFIDRLHAPSASVGLYLALLVSGIWLGSLLASQLIARFSLTRFVVVANAVSVAAAASFLGLLIADRATLFGTIATMFVFSVGVGAAAPAALVKAISVNPRVTGTASGLYGSVQMAVAGVLVMLAGLGANPAFASAAVLLAAGVVAQVSFWIARNRSAAVVKPEKPVGRVRRAATVTALSAAFRELVADLGQKNDFLGRRRRRRGLLRRLPGHSVDRLDGNEQRDGDNEKVNHHSDEIAVGEDAALLSRIRQIGCGNALESGTIIVGEVGLSGDAEDRHDDVVDQSVDDLAERRANDHADGEAQRIAFEREFLEFIPTWAIVLARRTRLRWASQFGKLAEPS